MIVGVVAGIVGDGGAATNVDELNVLGVLGDVEVVDGVRKARSSWWSRLALGSTETAVTVHWSCARRRLSSGADDVHISKPIWTNQKVYEMRMSTVSEMDKVRRSRGHRAHRRHVIGGGEARVSMRPVT